MNTKYLKYIISIADYESLAEAAKTLNISYVALSNYLKQYEQTLGTSLFVRQSGKYLATKAGRIYIDAAREVIEIESRIAKEIDKLSSDYTEIIRIGATPQRGEQTIAMVFQEFHQMYPHVKLKVTHCYPAQGRQMLLHNQLDLVMGAEIISKRNDFDFFLNSKEELLLILPDHYSVPFTASDNPRLDGSVRIDQFRDFVFILYDKGTGARMQIDRVFETAGFKPSIIYETNSPNVILHMIRGGHGIGFLPTQHSQNGGGIKRYALDPPCYFYHGVTVRKNYSFSKAEAYFVNQIARHFKFNGG